MSEVLKPTIDELVFPLVRESKENGEAGMWDFYHLEYVRDTVSMISPSYEKELQRENLSTSHMQEIAVLHDIVRLLHNPKADQEAEIIRQTFLTMTGHTNKEIETMENVIHEEEMERTKEPPSRAVQILRDADICFQVDPHTFNHRRSFWPQDLDTLKKLGSRIITNYDTWKTLGNGSLFYTSWARERYDFFVERELEMWQEIIAGKINPFSEL